MNGTNNIEELIKAEARNTAANIRAAAEKDAENIISDAKKQCAEINEQLKRDIDSEIKAVQKRADAARDAYRRTRLLEEKQKILSEITIGSLQKISALSDSEYEAVVLSLLKKRVHEGSAVIYLPQSRAHSREFFLELKKTAAAARCKYRVAYDRPIENGFITVYGNIEENCTFEELFNDNKDAIFTDSARVLFGTEDDT